MKKREFFDKALGEAMEQIKGRGYHKKFTGGGKTVYLAAFAFLGRDDLDYEQGAVSPLQALK